MSALGQKQTCAAHKGTSALPLKADMDASFNRGVRAACSRSLRGN